jgi:hypothetical protein
MICPRAVRAKAVSPLRSATAVQDARGFKPLANRFRRNGEGRAYLESFPQYLVVCRNSGSYKITQTCWQ